MKMVKKWKFERRVYILAGMQLRWPVKPVQKYVYLQVLSIGLNFVKVYILTTPWIVYKYLQVLLVMWHACPR